MLSIGKFFERIQNVRMKGHVLRAAVQSAIKKHISVDVPIESISITSSTVVLKNVSQSLRSAIFIKKVAILKDVNAAQTVREISEIR